MLQAGATRGHRVAAGLGKSAPPVAFPATPSLPRCYRHAALARKPAVRSPTPLNAYIAERASVAEQRPKYNVLNLLAESVELNVRAYWLTLQIGRLADLAGCRALTVCVPAGAGAAL